MTNPNEELAFQIQRAEKAQTQLQNFKKQAKELEEFLESEATKKQAEIRKLKQQSIMKEKNYKLQKLQLTQLQSQNANLKEQVSSSQNNKIDSTLITKLEAEIQSLKKVQQDLKKELQKEKQKALGQEVFYKKIETQWKGKQTTLKDEIQQGKNEIEGVKKTCEQLKKINQDLKKSNEQLRKGLQKGIKSNKQVEIQRKSSKKDIKFMKETVEKDKSQEIIRQLQQANQKLKQSLIKSQKAIKQLKSKIQAISDQNEQLHSKILSYSKINAISQSSFNSPFTIKTVIEQEQDTSINRINYSCLLLTKPHYISPFLQIIEDKSMLKIYKSTRTGTFQKSVGYYKHKFDNLTFQQDQLIEPIVNNIIDSQEISSHSIVLFGVKKSNKKYIMSKIISKLKDFILGKLQEDQEFSCTFIKKSQEQQKNMTQNAQTKEKIIELIDKVIGIAVKSEKGKEKYGSVKKVQSKPKVRYFNFKTNNFNLQIGTSSFTNLTFRDKMTSNNMFNNILYSKLPDVLQSSISHKYLILTINPIVDLYEDCKNTLSTTFCRAVESKQDQNREWKSSPVKEELNDVAKKKLQNFERENEQTSIKIRKLQEDCIYYKSRFDQLEFRLKNLLNTHSGQNSYLKKSPITLSYQKLLKFVHSVQGRSGGGLNASQYGSTSMLLKNSHLNTEKEQLDAL